MHHYSPSLLPLSLESTVILIPATREAQVLPQEASSHYVLPGLLLETRCWRSAASLLVPRQAALVRVPAEVILLPCSDTHSVISPSSPCWAEETSPLTVPPAPKQSLRFPGSPGKLQLPQCCAALQPEPGCALRAMCWLVTTDRRFPAPSTQGHCTASGAVWLEPDICGAPGISQGAQRVGSTTCWLTQQHLLRATACPARGLQGAFAVTESMAGAARHEHVL